MKKLTKAQVERRVAVQAEVRAVVETMFAELDAVPSGRAIGAATAELREAVTKAAKALARRKLGRGVYLVIRDEMSSASPFSFDNGRGCVAHDMIKREQLMELVDAITW